MTVFGKAQMQRGGVIYLALLGVVFLLRKSDIAPVSAVISYSLSHSRSEYLCVAISLAERRI